MYKSILTLDLATMSGFCNWKPGSLPVISNSDLKLWYSDRYYKALAVHYKRLMQNIEENEVDLLVFEAPMIVRQGIKTTKTVNARKTIGLANIVELIGGQLEIEVAETEVSQWRKHVLGHGQLSTEEAKRRAMSIARGCGLDPKTHDAAEAFCIMDYVADIKRMKKDWPETYLFRLR